ncbi:YciE/YciF ferroxidase family protein [Lichenicoccus roseus]|uniref:Ferritin-like domain-containing protein n=1 Tax=Lichenicoccus roseus TaxID=2683649 RepID=A0A5R9J596_9PROT|nr:ferritin-like domain-containing protein [Lichenicoccus roseus]TLU72800.1 ferritin-like domain-containing protein [Lichenicoccus roseus]
MSAPESLKEVYTDELKDLWSANDQMTKAIKTLSEKIHDKKLKELFEGSHAGIEGHTATIRSLLEAAGGEVEKEHCKGMEGLVKEALKHGLKEAPEDGDLLDIVLIAQYQRMSHYGVTGFGTAAAYATALGLKDDAKQLKGIVADIYKADEYTSKQSERLARLAARHAAATTD